MPRMVIPGSFEYKRGKASRHTRDPELRNRIFSRDGFICKICGTSDNLTIDHIISVYRGGGNEDDNLQALCNRCNSGKAP